MGDNTHLSRKEDSSNTQFDKIRNKIQKQIRSSTKRKHEKSPNVLELKNTMIELKNAIESFNRRLN